MSNSKIVKIPPEYEKAKLLLEEYKRIRKSLGKPIRTLNKKQILEDLTGKEFKTLLEEIERQKSNG